jgi:glycine/sarcosine/betaine reductase complex component A
MNPENQATIKTLAEDHPGDMIVVLGASDIEGAEIAAETVTEGDPTFAGPLAGVSLGLQVFHILEPEFKKVIPSDIYEEHLGIWELSIDTEDIEKRFKAIRSRAQKLPNNDNNKV